jgi:hypothetical protein
MQCELEKQAEQSMVNWSSANLNNTEHRQIQIRNQKPNSKRKLSWSGTRTPDNAGPVTCAVTRNDRKDIADREDVADWEQVADREDAVDIRVLEIETEIAFFRDRK